MSLAAGTRLGPYEIQSALGAGGMGEVYRARDTRLDRDVAIKTLPDAFVGDPERVARFEREAKTLAALNHPNIAAIYGFEKGPPEGGHYAPSDAVSGLSRTLHALVLELVEGPTLADRIAQGPLPVAEALPIARQIALALEAAHEHGVIHRDLKPANIKVRDDGAVKVLDFGLAKLTGPSDLGHDGRPDLTASPTITNVAVATGVGVLLGTAAYMSPEQAKGRPADKRSDLWAFGCVLYEMLTGRRAFDGEDLTDTIASVVKSEPDWRALPPDAPPAVATIVRRCLEKDRRKRVADVAVVLFVLDETREGEARPAPVAGAGPNRPWRHLVVHAATLAVGALLAGSAVWFAMRPDAPRVTRFAITPTGSAAVTAITLDRELVITPDGARVVYVGNSGTQLFVRALDQLELTPLAGLGTPRSPFLSPDGQWIGFFDGSGTSVSLKKVSITGGPALTICGFSGQRAGGAWAEDGTIVFATTDPTSGLWRVSSAGGEPTQLTTPSREAGEADHLWPELLPGGRAVLFTITPTSGGIETAQIAVLDLTTGTRKILVRGGSHAQYAPSGHLVYGVQGTLRAMAFDLDRLEVSGSPVPVLSRVVTTDAGAANFAVSRTGTLVYVPGDGPGAVAAAPERRLAWVDRQGREQPINAAPRAYTVPRLSPDGTRVALEIRDQQNDIWIWNLAGETLTRLTTSPGLDTDPVWMPDGRRLVFSSQVAQGNNSRTLHWQPADGAGAAERLATSTTAQFATDVTPDGTRILFNSAVSAGNVMLYTVGKEGVAPLVASTFADRNAQVSPDGRWLAYEALDSGQPQVYIRPFPDVNSARWQVSTTGGRQPVWARNGRELFFRSLAGEVMSVRVEAGPSWKGAVPVRVFDGPYVLAAGTGGSARTFDVSPDATRFLMIKPGPSERLGEEPQAPARSAEEGLVVVQNWHQELERLASAD